MQGLVRHVAPRLPTFRVPRQTVAFTTSILKEKEEPKDEKFLKKFGLHPDQLVASKDFNRWWLVPFAFANHVCMGSVLSWSIFNEPLTRLRGVVVPAAGDWSLGDVALGFSLVMGGFVWGGVFGKYLDRWGPRASCLIGGTCLGTGFALGALAIQTHSLPTLYLGAAIWGLANGWAYVPPVSVLLKWFPDRKGFASGACLVGYGGGAAIAAPLFSSFLAKFRQAPDYLGTVSELSLVNEGGRLFANVNDTLREVIVATASDAKLSGLAEGVYLVGSGSTGAAETFLTMGLAYSAVMIGSAFAFRLPPANYVSAASPGSPQPAQFDVALPVASRSPQFWIMWFGFGSAVTGAYGLLSSGKTMLTEVFGTTMPDIVTPTFATTFVGAMGAANLCGRLFWSNFSDYLGKYKGDSFQGRKLTFSLLWSMGPVLYLGTVYAAHSSVDAQGSVLPIAIFSGSVLGSVASFGGTAATRPALAGDLFGLKNVGVITARQMTVVMPASFLGPKIATYLRSRSIEEAIQDLSSKIDDETFKSAFGAAKDQLKLLIEQKTVTVSRLMELVPPGTIDPTPFVYDDALYILAGLQAFAFFSNQFLKPLPVDTHIKPVAPSAPPAAEKPDLAPSK